jgi:hypothetical protein
MNNCFTRSFFLGNTSKSKSYNDDDEHWNTSTSTRTSRVSLIESLRRLLIRLVAFRLHLGLSHCLSFSHNGVDNFGFRGELFCISASKWSSQFSVCSAIMLGWWWWLVSCVSSISQSSIPASCPLHWSIYKKSSSGIINIQLKEWD